MYSITFQPLHRLSPDELLAFSNLNSDLICEMNPNGTITLKKNLIFRYRKVQAAIVAALEKWNLRLEDGKVLDSHTGFILRNGAVRQPVVSWIRLYKADSQHEHLIQLAPDFVVEFLTEYDSQDAMHRKMKEYIANGCALGWLIDLQNEKVHIYRAFGNDEIVPNFGVKLSGDEVLRGFEMKL